MLGFENTALRIAYGYPYPFYFHARPQILTAKRPVSSQLLYTRDDPHSQHQVWVYFGHHMAG